MGYSDDVGNGSAESLKHKALTDYDRWGCSRRPHSNVRSIAPAAVEASRRNVSRRCLKVERKCEIIRK